MIYTLCLALFAGLQPVQEPGATYYPPGITKEKASEGWIALYDGETNYGWKTAGDMKIDKGILTIGGAQEASLTTTSAFSAFDFVLNYTFEGDSCDFTLSQGDLKKHVEGKAAPGHEVRKAELSGTNPAKTGPITITTKAGTTLHIKSITLKPLGGKSIFNGKNLDGWKEIPGRKSKFTITSAGEINVKDGNGDLQTIDQWDDFVLQMDIISNGDHLNSGVFFRCLPGEFWSGYEAQVRNEWEQTVTLVGGKSHTGLVTIKGDKVEVKAGRNKVTLEKKDVDSIKDHRDKPNDFGSGGIYNFVKARKVVSTDREWYTMTVIAHGNHLAVWVNGYQTAQFTDNRPVKASARQGRKDTAGPLSIQGHDPTTDLSFKNIRIAPLAK